MRILLLISMLYLGIGLNAEVILNKVERKQVDYALRLLDKIVKELNTYNEFNNIRDTELIKYYKTLFNVYNVTISSLEARIRWLEVINNGMAIEEAKEDFYKAEIDLAEVIKIRNQSELKLNKSISEYSSYINKNFLNTSKDKYRVLSILDDVNRIDQLYKDAQEIEKKSRSIKDTANTQWKNADSDITEAYDNFIKIDKKGEIIDTAKVRVYAENAIEKAEMARLKLSQFIEAYEQYIKAREETIRSEYGYIEAYRTLLIAQPQYFL